MNKQEQMLKKRVQIIVAACLSLFFVLVTVVVFQFAIRMNQDAQARALARQTEVMRKQIEQAEQDIEYFNSPEFQRDYASRYQNKGKPGDAVGG